MSGWKKVILLFMWCAVTFNISRISGLFFLEWRFIFMFWGGMAYMWGWQILTETKVKP